MWWQNSAPPSLVFSAGPITLHWYGLIFLTAFFLAAGIIWMVRHQHHAAWEHFGHPLSYLDLAADLVGYFILGVIGARLYEVFFVSWDFYRVNLELIPAIWQGGLAIQGGIVLVILALILRYRKHFPLIADWFVLGLVFAQALGRFGNYFNQELYGLPSTAWYAIYIEPRFRLPAYLNFETFQPTFLWESLALIILGFVLLALQKLRQRRPGFLAASYLIGAGIIRLLVEFWRLDPAPEYIGLRLPQIIAVGFIVAGSSWLINIFSLYSSSKLFKRPI